MKLKKLMTIHANNFTMGICGAIVCFIFRYFDLINDTLGLILCFIFSIYAFFHFGIYYALYKHRENNKNDILNK